MLVVRDYIDTAQPVGSQRLVEHYHLDMSSATIRNEMAALTEMGYLRQPHTSAGRVPSEDGYRYFVSHMMHQVELPEAIQHTISHQFYQARPEVEQWMTLAASVLAHQSQAVSLVTAPHAEKCAFQARRTDLHPGTAGADGAGHGWRGGQPANSDAGRTGSTGTAFSDGQSSQSKFPGAHDSMKSPPPRPAQMPLKPISAL